MRKRRKNRSTRSQLLLIVGSLLILIGIVVMTKKYFSAMLIESDEKSALNTFYVKQQAIKIDEDNDDKKLIQSENDSDISYIASINIPKIQLERGLVSKDSPYNNIDNNIQILKESDMPDKEKGNLILASHSGNTRVSYFKNLSSLSYGDEVFIIYNFHRYYYRVINIYSITKNGYANIIRNSEKTTLTLITCEDNDIKQIIVICELFKIV